MLWLSGWWNVIYFIPFGLAFLYLLAYTCSGWTFGDADADGEFSVDHDLDTGDVSADHDLSASHNIGDNDVSADHDLNADHDANAVRDIDIAHDIEGDHDGEAGTGAAMAALVWLGVGRVPLSIVLMVLMLSWGVVGFSLNQALHPYITNGDILGAVTMPLALIASAIFARFVSRGMARYAPTSETYARRRHELLGRTGVALFPIDERFGLVAVRDEQGNLIQVACRTSDANLRIEKNDPVQLTGYRAREGYFYVMPANAPTQKPDEALTPSKVA